MGERRRAREARVGEAPGRSRGCRRGHVHGAGLALRPGGRGGLRGAARALVGHSYRTWLFGRALAAVDRADLDVELFYCGSLLHDYGIAKPTPGRDFTLASADRTLEAASAAEVGSHRAEAVADAICVHTTPGVTVDRDGALGAYIQWGAMVDAAGLRMWDVAPANVEEVLRRHPRPGFKRELIAMMRAEAAAVPGGRFELLVRCGVPLAVRMAPFES